MLCKKHKVTYLNFSPHNKTRIRSRGPQMKIHCVNYILLHLRGRLKLHKQNNKGLPKNKQKLESQK